MTKIIKDLKLSAILYFLFIFSIYGQKVQLSSSIEDTTIIESIIRKYKNYKAIPAGDLLVKIAGTFIDAPYVGSTLEIYKEERLIINLRELDCTTFAENCLALMRTIKKSDPKVQEFYNELKLIRYRNGKIDGYPSRLHYFSDWIYDNQKKKIVQDIRGSFRANEFNPKVFFMSKNPEKYPMFKGHPEFIKKMSKIEKIISSRKLKYIPKDKIAENEQYIQNGDIIGITTNIEGMDIMHVVIAIKQEKETHIIHASLQHHKVLISDETLADYVNSKKAATGIIVVRPVSE